MKLVVTGFLYCVLVSVASAGNLSVSGDLTVTGNMAAGSITLGNQTCSNWPSGGSGSFVDLGNNPVLDTTGTFYSIVLTADAAWDFGTHATGRVFRLKLAQDGNGPWQNTWPPDVLWPGGTGPAVSTTANRFDLLRFVDDGANWLGVVEGLNYGAVDWALQFNGSQNYVAVDGSSAFIGDNMTYEFWLKAPDQSDRPLLVFAEPDSVGFVCHTRSGGTQMRIATDSQESSWTYFDFNTPQYLDGQWHHVAIHETSGVWQLTIDNTVSTNWDNGSAPQVPAGGTPLTFAKGYWGGGTFLAGVMDEVRITNNGTLVGYWKFNDSTGATASDSSGYGNTGTLQGSPLPSWVPGVSCSNSPSASYSQNQAGLSLQRFNAGTVLGQTNSLTAPGLLVPSSLTATGRLNQVPLPQP